MTLEDRVRQYYALLGEGKHKELAAMFTDDNMVVDFRGVQHQGTGVVRMLELYPPGTKIEPVALATDGRSVHVSYRITGGPPGRSTEGQDYFVFYGEKIRTLKTTLSPA
jgi:SnoaL-like protein